MNKRHAKPTDSALIQRIYRGQLLDRAALGALASAQAMLSQRMESFRILAEHCERLLREKETLVKMIGLETIAKRQQQANDFMAQKMSAAPTDVVGPILRPWPDPSQSIEQALQNMADSKETASHPGLIAGIKVKKVPPGWSYERRYTGGSPYVLCSKIGCPNQATHSFDIVNSCEDHWREVTVGATP